jgi:hypothetical protein
MAEKKTTKKTETKQTQAKNAADKPVTRRKKTADESAVCKQEARYEGASSKTGKKPASAKTKQAASGKKTVGKKSVNRESAPETKPDKDNEKKEKGVGAIHAFMPWILWVVSFFTLISFLLIDLLKEVDAARGVGMVGAWLRNFLCGLFGVGALLVPVVLAVLAYFWRKAAEKHALLAKCFYAIMTVLMPSALWHAVTRFDQPSWRITELWSLGVSFQGGGLFGGLLGEVLKLGGIVGASIVGVLGMAIFSVLLFGITPDYVIMAIRYRRKLRQEARESLDAE